MVNKRGPEGARAGVWRVTKSFFDVLHDYHCRASKLHLYCILIRK